MWSRIYLIPLLQAEEDRDAVRRHYAQQKMEEELLGKAQPVYHSDRYVLPAHQGLGKEASADAQEGSCGRRTLLRPQMSPNRPTRSRILYIRWSSGSFESKRSLFCFREVTDRQFEYPTKSNRPDGRIAHFPVISPCVQA